MSTLAQIRAAIAAKLRAVTDIGQVHDWERYAAQQGDFRGLYTTEIGGVKQVRGWHLRRIATSETSPAVGRNVVTHEWEIRGFCALDDARQTETVFDTLIEAVRDAFRLDETLGGVVASTVTEEIAGAQVEESLPVLFAGVLCHSVRLRLATRHYL